MNHSRNIILIKIKYRILKDVERIKYTEIRDEQRRVSMEPAPIIKVVSSTIAVPYFRNERARYLDVKKGFWLR
jgi:hypothetical protein